MKRQTTPAELAFGAAVLAMALGAYVALALAEKPTGELVTMIGPILAALFIVRRVDARTDEQNRAINRVEKQTNGQLDQRIKDNVRAVLEERDP